MVVEVERYAQVEDNTAVVTLRHGAFDPPVGRFDANLAAPAGSVLEVEQGNVFILPEVVLLEINVYFFAISVDNADVGDVKAGVLELDGCIGSADTLVLLTSGERGVTDYRLEIDRDRLLR